MSKRIGGKLVGAALSVAVLGGCTTPIEGTATSVRPQQEQERPDTREQRFIDAGRYMTHVITCIANDEKSEMTNLDQHQLDNAAEAMPVGEKRGVQPVQIRIQRNLGPKYEEGSWTAYYRESPAPGAHPPYAMQARGDVPLPNDFWKDASTTNLNLAQAEAGANEIVPASLGFATPGTDLSVAKRDDDYFYTYPARHQPLNEQELKTFLDSTQVIADRMLELSGLNEAACFLD